MFIQTKTSARLGNIGRWGTLPISMVLRSERSLKSNILSLAWTSKYVNNISVLSIKKVSGGHLVRNGLAKLDSYCSDKLIFMLSYRIVASNKYIYAI